jgi:3-methyladenine DNA glycosylase AlkD
MLAIFTADPKLLTPSEADRWARDIQSWDVCDGCAIHLFRKTPFAWELAWKWARRKPEFVRRSGFALFAALTVHDKRAADELFLEVLPLIEATATDERNFVKKAVNWALRQIGKHNPTLRKAALETAERLARSESASARWIGKDALREFARRPF